MFLELNEIEKEMRKNVLFVICGMKVGFGSIS